MSSKMSVEVRTLTQEEQQKVLMVRHSHLLTHQGSFFLELLQRLVMDKHKAPDGSQTYLSVDEAVKRAEQAAKQGFEAIINNGWCGEMAKLDDLVERERANPPGFHHMMNGVSQ